MDRTKNLPYLHPASCFSSRFSAPSHFFRLARRSHIDASADAFALRLVAGAMGLNLVGKREMKLNICMFAMLAVVAAGATMTCEASGADVPQVDLTDWTPPSIGSVGDDPFGRLVKYGYALFTDTPNQIGLAAPDPAKRFSRSSLTCQNCHLKAGTQPYAVPLMGVWGQFPQYRGREGEIGTLEESHQWLLGAQHERPCHAARCDRNEGVSCLYEMAVDQNSGWRQAR